MRASDRVTGVGIRIPLCTCTLKAARRGRRPAVERSGTNALGVRRPVSARLLFRSVGADDPVHPVPLSLRASARTGVGIRFPLPPSAREVAARSADGGSDIARQFLSPSRPRRQPPPSGGIAARRCRADGTSYPKGICSAALHGRTPSPTGGSTHLPRRALALRPPFIPAGVFVYRTAEQSIPPVMQCAHLPFRRQQASSHPLTCHGMVPQASRTHFFRHDKTPRLSSWGSVLALPIFPGRLQPSIVSRSELN